ncbi:hypothetical protein HDU85_007826 [Gaertneriomyces sp. JEL0708]|nr:hypothetical protein HDU85_007826 [Gaertneriomyces sp. JEL0708]
MAELVAVELEGVDHVAIEHSVARVEAVALLAIDADFVERVLELGERLENRGSSRKDDVRKRMLDAFIVASGRQSGKKRFRAIALARQV